MQVWYSMYMAKKRKKTDSTKKRKSSTNPFKYTVQKKKQIKGVLVLKIVGLPGYLTSGFSWLSLVGFACYQILTRLTTVSSDTGASGESSPLTVFLSDEYIYSPSLAAQIFSYVLAIVVVVLGLVATIYFFKILVRYTALLINWAATAVAPPERTYFFKIELGLLGWTLLALTMIYMGELPWIATLTAAFASSIVAISFAAEHQLLKKRELSETDIWQ